MTERMKEARLMDVDERVQAGIRVLDEQDPGWRDRIDLEHLDLGEPIVDEDTGCGCVCAQLYGSYHQGVETLTGWSLSGWDPDEAVRAQRWAFDHGFDIGTAPDVGTAEWDRLTSAWVAALSREPSR